jgi:hypothetical protein
VKTRLKSYASSITVIALVVLFNACNTTPTNSTTPPPPPSPNPGNTTLYRGDWGWAAVNLNNANDYISGIAAFSDEITNDSNSSAQFGKKIAVGYYDVVGVTTKPVDLALMGAISSPLDAGFALGDRVLMIAVDANGTIETGSSGRSTFSGLGRVYASDGTFVSVSVAFVQSDNTPTYANANARVSAASPLLEPMRFTTFAPIQPLVASSRTAMTRSEQLAAAGVVSSGNGPLHGLFR